MSNVSVSNSHFINHIGGSYISDPGIGVVAVDQDCNLYVINGTFSNNMVQSVITSCRSTVSISDNSMFLSNDASLHGGTV